MSDKIVKYALFDERLLGLGVLTTPTLDVRSAKNIQGLRIKATSVINQSLVDFKVDMAVSDYIAPPNQPVFVTAPVEDFDAFTTSILDHWNTTANPTDWQNLPMPAPLAPFIQIRFTGLSTNPVDTVITVKLIVQESV